MTEVYLFGSLRKGQADPSGKPLFIDLQGPTALLEVIRNLGIPKGTVQLAMVNHRSVPKEASVRPGDRLSLFPREYVIFGEWQDHRF